MEIILDPFEKVSVNGELFSAYTPIIPANDQGLLYGYGVFDTLRIYNAVPFMFERHIERLLNSCLSLGIPVESFDKFLQTWIYDFVLGLGVKNFILRVTVTKGVRGTPTVIITGRHLAYTSAHYISGFRASLSKIKRNHESPLAKIKSLNFLDNVLARRMASESGFDEALMLNSSNFLSECSMSNLFFIKKEKVFTPSIQCGALQGITRAIVIEKILPSIELQLCEGEFSITDFLEADEAFITNAAMGIMPLVSLDTVNIGSGNPGELTKHLVISYEKLIDESIAREIEMRRQI